MATSELLTPDEHAAVALLADLTGMMFRIIEAGGDRADHGEVTHYVHGLQNMVLANAAARAYPGAYRLLGGNMSDVIVGTVELKVTADDDPELDRIVRSFIDALDTGDVDTAKLQIELLRDFAQSNT